MATVKKKTTKKTTEKKAAVAAKKAPAKKSAAKKVVGKKAAPKKAAPKKAPAKKAAPKVRQISAEERYQMIETAAYFRAERDNFQSDASQYWTQAEQEISRMLAKK